MGKLLFGTAGIPFSSKKRETIEGIKTVKKIGLDCMEIEFVQGVRMGEKTAQKVFKEHVNSEIPLSVHAPYFINLNANDEVKRKKSIERIVKSARIGKICGADKVTFHPGYYLEDDEKTCFKNTLNSLHELLQDVPEGIKINPETSGKISAFGSIDELLDLCKEIEELSICIDFSHVYSRSLGEINTYSAFASIIEKTIKVIPGYENEVHFHVSGIKYGKKGELKHLPFSESDFNWKDLIKVFSDFNLKGVVICESPILEEDAKLIKDYYWAL